VVNLPKSERLRLQLLLTQYLLRVVLHSNHKKTQDIYRGVKCSPYILKPNIFIEDATESI
jgi:hypothetical protein